MTGRFVWADVKWQKHGSSEVNGHKTTRMRDVGFWAKVFDDTRPMRMDTARRLIAELDYPEWMRAQLLAEMPNTARILEGRNSTVRERGHEFEHNYGAEHGEDPAHERLKRAMMDRVGKK